MFVLNLTWFYTCYGLLLGSRIIEIIVSRDHEHLLTQHHQAQLLDPREFAPLVIFHLLWLSALVVEFEFNSHPEIIVSTYWVVGFFTVLCMAQLLRWWSVCSLGVYWTAKLFRCSPHPLILKGPYKWFQHPSYLAVLSEFLAFPLLFGLKWTFFIFFPLKFLILLNRVRLEFQITQRYF